MQTDRGARIGSALWALGLAATMIGLPLAVEFSSEQETLAIRPAIEAVAVAESVQLVDALPLLIDRGTMRSVGRTIQKPDEHVSRIEVEAASFRVPLLSGAAGLTAEARQSAPQTPDAPLLAQLASLNFGTLIVRRSRLDFVTAHGMPVTFTDVNLEVTASRRSAFQAKGTALLFGQTVRIEASGSVPTPEQRATAGKRLSVPVKLSLRANHLEANFEGRLLAGDGVRLVGEADIRSRRLRALGRWFGMRVPTATDLKDTSLSGALDWSDGRLSFTKAQVAVDGNKGEGVLTLRLGGDRPGIDGTLNFKTFDLTPHINAQLHAEAAHDQARKSEPGATAGSLVTALDADLRLSAEKVTAPMVEAGRGALTLSLKAGRMQADLAELELEGGSVVGQILLETAGERPRLAIKGRATRFDAGRIFTEPLRRNPLLGRANIVVDGAGTGTTLPEMLAGFTGKGAFSVIEGARLGLDLKALAYAARQAKQVGWSAAGRGITPLDRLELKYQLASGALSIEDLNGRAPNVGVLHGSGKVDIPGRLLDLTVAVRGPARPGGEVDPAAEEVIVIRGAWNDPAIGLLGKPFTSPPSPPPSLKGAATGVPALPAGR